MAYVSQILHKTPIFEGEHKPIIEPLHTVWFIRDTFIRDIWRISEILGDISY